MRMFAIIVIATLGLGLGGCSLEEARAMAQHAHAAVQVAQAAVAEARQHAELIGGEKGAEIIAKTEKALADAEEWALKADKAVAAAEAAREAGGSILDMVLGALATVFPPLAIISEWRSRKRLAAATSASRLAQDLKALAAKADAQATDDRVLLAAIEQRRAGVDGLVDSIRKG